MESLPVATSDGHRFEARFHAPAAGRGRALFAIFPAMGVGARYYDPLGAALAQAGASAVVAELRGQGTSSLRAGRGSDWGYEEAVRHDYPALLAAARERSGDGPLYLLGHSLGGQLAALFLAASPGAADGLVLVASGSVYHRGWPFPKSLSLLVKTQLVGAVARALGYFPGDKVGFGGRQARREMLDWSANARTGRYAPGGATIDYERALAVVRTPVWSFSLEGDDFAPPRAMAHLTGKLTAARVSHRHLGPLDLPAECLHHFSWARRPEAIVRRLLQEIDAQGA